MGQKEEKKMLSASQEAQVISAWPESLREYVKLCFAKCITNEVKGKVEKTLKIEINKANALGEVWSKNWKNDQVIKIPCVTTPGSQKCSNSKCVINPPCNTSLSVTLDNSGTADSLRKAKLQQMVVLNRVNMKILVKFYSYQLSSAVNSCQQLMTAVKS